MATKKTYIYQKPNIDSQPWPIDPNGSVTINAQSLVYYDTSAGWILPLANDVNGANFVGLMNDQQPTQIYASGMFDQTQNPTEPNFPDNTAMVIRYGQAKLKATASETYNPGTRVCAGADAQTISTSGSNYIGYVSGEQTPVTNATAGQPILIDFRAQYPNVNLS